MSEFDFVLKFNLVDPSANPEDHIVALGEVGCTDALVGVGQMGIIALDFSREAASAREAVTSAIRDVKSAIPGAELVEVTPDIGGLTDVADILGFSRQYMRKIAYGCVPSFPAPVHEGKPSMWHLAPVLRWFENVRNKDVDDALIDLAQLNMHLNTVVSEAHTDRDEIDDLRALLA